MALYNQCCTSGSTVQSVAWLKWQCWTRSLLHRLIFKTHYFDMKIYRWLKKWRIIIQFEWFSFNVSSCMHHILQLTFFLKHYPMYDIELDNRIRLLAKKYTNNTKLLSIASTKFVLTAFTTSYSLYFHISPTLHLNVDAHQSVPINALHTHWFNQRIVTGMEKL